MSDHGGEIDIGARSSGDDLPVDRTRQIDGIAPRRNPALGNEALEHEGHGVLAFCQAAKLDPCSASSISSGAGSNPGPMATPSCRTCASMVSSPARSAANIGPPFTAGKP